MEQWMIDALDEYHRMEELMREEEFEEKHNPNTCFCTEHW